MIMTLLEDSNIKDVTFLHLRFQTNGKVLSMLKREREREREREKE
jgi:hypothetical protein